MLRQYLCKNQCHQRKRIKKNQIMQSSKPTQKLKTLFESEVSGGTDQFFFLLFLFFPKIVFECISIEEFSVGIFVHAKDLIFLGEKKRERGRKRMTRRDSKRREENNVGHP
ncbi:hypothetical protein ACJW30_06G100000 [Castanea mollissima]